MRELVRALIVLAFAFTLMVSLVLRGLFCAARALVLAVVRHRSRQLGAVIARADQARSTR